MHALLTVLLRVLYKQQYYQHTHLEKDEDEEQLIDDSDTKPEPPVSYKERERCWEVSTVVSAVSEKKY